ncbi:unnamed protein product [Calypogeia fissa]
MGPLQQIPLVAWCVVVGIPLLGFVLRRHRNSAETAGVEENGPEVDDSLFVNDSLYTLHRPEGVPNLQVLFFHGLPLGKFSTVHLSTWVCGDGSSRIWPQTWLVEEFPKAHVFSVRYSEGLREGSVERFHMKNIGENLLWDLLDGGIGQVPNCPVVLVGHCIGGLVIKRLCLEAYRTQTLSGESRNHRAKLKNFLKRIKAMFYYATPHHGIPHIAKAADLLDSPLFKYFETLSTEAAWLNSEFQNLWELRGWQVWGLGEIRNVESGVFEGMVVVPEASARQGIFNVDGTADHFSISKPPSKTSRRFNTLTKLLRNVLNDSKEETHPANFQYIPKTQITGIDSPLREVKERLKNVTKLCLTGMGGLGKTTLVKVVFNELALEFEYTCFVLDVKLKKWNVEALKEHVWSCMYYDGEKVGGESDWSSLRGRKLLLVLDDISTECDLQVLSEIADAASLESRFIATSRDGHLMEQKYTYPVPFLQDNLGQQLFMSCAFPSADTPPANLKRFISEIVKNCDGLPLTLEVVGKWLRDTPKEGEWEQALHALRKAGENFEVGLWEKLRLSYDGLEGENVKEMFLDATTFFCTDPQWTLRDAKAAWRKAYDVIEIPLWRTLVNRSLVYDVGEDETIKVHEQLKSLGQKIASKSDNKHRVWDRLEALKLLQSTNASNKQNIHALRLERVFGAGKEQIHIASSNLPKLKNLRYLQIEAPDVLQAAQEDKWCPSNLVLLKCMGLQSFELALQSRLTLVILVLDNVSADYLPNSIGQLSALRIFRLLSAPNLQNIPDEFGHLLELEIWELVYCPGLKTLPETFVLLSNLKVLKLRECGTLRTLPKDFGKLSALSHVELSYCENLQTLPESFGELLALTHLEIEFCKEFHSLPESFGRLCSLVEVKFRGCEMLESLPDSFGHLLELSHLEFLDCGLLSLPESFGNLASLSHLIIGGCLRLFSLPESFGYLSSLTHLQVERCAYFRNVPETFTLLSSLVELKFKDCPMLDTLPANFWDLPALSHLELAECGLQGLPESFGNLFKLKHLKLQDLVLSY